VLANSVVTEITARNESAAVLDWVERVGEFFEANYGFPPITGRIVGWLLVCEPAEQSAAEIARAIKASRASLTTNMRALTASGLVRRMRRAGDRTAYYRIEDDAWETVIRHRMASLAAIKDLAVEGMDLVGPASPRAARLRATDEAFAWFEALMAGAVGPLAVARAAASSASAASGYRVRGLTKVYRTEAAAVRALDGVDLDIAPGELMVLLGPSGSGKSTLLNILGGLDRATSGEVIFDGQDITGASDAELTRYRRRAVGFIFQFFNLTPSLTARENVELITEIADDPMKPDEALALVGLADRLDHFPAELSGGQQQRVAVARAIAKRPKVLFCDEPTGSLDSASGVRVLEAIVKVAAETGATVVMVTHNAAIAEIADRVVRFRDGKVADIGVNAQRKQPAEVRW